MCRGLAPVCRRLSVVSTAPTFGRTMGLFSAPVHRHCFPNVWKAAAVLCVCFDVPTSVYPPSLIAPRRVVNALDCGGCQPFHTPGRAAEQYVWVVNGSLRSYSVSPRFLFGFVCLQVAGLKCTRFLILPIRKLAQLFFTVFFFRAIMREPDTVFSMVLNERHTIIGHFFQNAFPYFDLK